MPETVMSSYPRTRPAQLKFNKCKTGDIIWFTGGYTIAGDWQSFGRRAKVTGIQEGKHGGILVKPDNDPSETYCLTHFITKDDILASLETCTTPEEREAYLAQYQLKPGDLAVSSSATKKAPSSLEAMTKKELIELVKTMAAELDALKTRVASE